MFYLRVRIADYGIVAGPTAFLRVHSVRSAELSAPSEKAVQSQAAQALMADALLLARQAFRILSSSIAFSKANNRGDD